MPAVAEGMNAVISNSLLGFLVDNVSRLLPNLYHVIDRNPTNKSLLYVAYHRAVETS
jgi:hypothetical protein